MSVQTKYLLKKELTSKESKKSVYSYYPFGMPMPNRTYSLSSSKYRFGFNGQEKDDEVYGEGNAVSFKFRIHDTRLGRFLSVDPLTKSYPSISPYVFAENDVIRAIDFEGLEKYIVTARAFIPMATVANPSFVPFINDKVASFAGDNRNYYSVNNASYRTEQKVSVDFDNKQVTTLNNTASGSVGLDNKGGVSATSPAAPAGPNPTYNKAALDKGTTTTVNMQVNASNKLVSGAPSINYDLSVTLTPNVDANGKPIMDNNGTQSFNYQVKGASDGFPAYELWVTDKTSNKSFLIFNRTPTQTGETPMSLFPPMEHKYNVQGNSSNLTPSTTVPFNKAPNTPDCTGTNCPQ